MPAKKNTNTTVTTKKDSVPVLPTLPLKTISTNSYLVFIYLEFDFIEQVYKFNGFTFIIDFNSF